MKSTVLSLTLFAAVAAVAPLTAQPVTYKIDSAHSSAMFSVRHMMVSNARGEFSKMEGVVVYDANNLAGSKVEAIIDASSINTHEPRRDAHLKSPDFFDVAKFPTLTFKSKQFYKEAGQVKVKGDLMIHGVTKEVILALDGPTPEVKSPRGGIVIGASASTKINRKDFGLVYNAALETGGVLVGDEVSINLEIEGIRQ